MGMKLEIEEIERAMAIISLRNPNPSRVDRVALECCKRVIKQKRANLKHYEANRDKLIARSIEWQNTHRKKAHESEIQEDL